jgi:MftR C-terminal domain
LVFVWYDDLTEKLIAACAAIPLEETPYEAVSAALRGLLRLYDANPKWSKKMVRLASETPALVGKSHEKRAMWGRALAATIAERMDESPMRDLYAQIIATTAINAFALSVEAWFAGGATGELRAIVDAGLACAGAVGSR